MNRPIVRFDGLRYAAATRFTDAGVTSGGANWRDLGVHLSIAQTLNSGGNFPPDVPYFAGEPLVYHWFADFHAAIAAKAVNELRYHRDYAAGWVVRLGDGTGLSHDRARDGLEAVWPLVAELFETHDVERRLADAGVAVDPAELRDAFDGVIATVLDAARLAVPDGAPLARAAGRAGRDGPHTEAMGYLLAELQGVARQHPDATW